jgi:hypothetical protein
MMGGMSNAEPSGLSEDDGPTDPTGDLSARVIPAGVVLGDGRGQAIAVLVLRILRMSSMALMVAGVAVAIAFGRWNENVVGELSTVSGMLHAARTPLVVLAGGVLLRLLLAPLALLLAWEVVVRSDRDVAPSVDDRRIFSRLTDRVRVASGLRDLRWTVAVKREAAARLGVVGHALVLAELVARLMAVLGVVAIFVIIAVA